MKFSPFPKHFILLDLDILHSIMFTAAQMRPVIGRGDNFTLAKRLQIKLQLFVFSS